MICKKCCSKFYEPKTVRTTYENYLGIAESRNTYLCLDVCPYCGSDEFDEEEEED